MIEYAQKEMNNTKNKQTIQREYNENGTYIVATDNIISDNSDRVINDESGVKKEVLSRRLTNFLRKLAVAIFPSGTDRSKHLLTSRMSIRSNIKS